MQVIRQSISTSSASVRILKRKCAEMQIIQQLVAKEESSALLKMVDYFTEAAWQLLMQEAGILSPIGASHVLAIKAGLAIPWT